MLPTALNTLWNQMIQRTSPVRRLKSEHKGMRKFSPSACSARDKMYAQNNQLRYLITELANAAQTPEGVPVLADPACRRAFQRFAKLKGQEIVGKVLWRG